MDEVTEQRNFFQDLSLRQAGLIKDKAADSERTPVRINKSRMTPGQMAAKMESDRNRNYWKKIAEDAKLNGELSENVISITEDLNGKE